ncbi:DUF4893 domain-containing protein [Flavobacterium wongokense]|uniref:DUF4893 domain-containing protein n=1 Tax=Flavobacterium wongokense TaxID=2910674 RepID=UPI001F28424C|nr:DUF4893 domain-containing protein [Flavobacterium sp. WG47]MCF6132610.1 DUF4893 domain-containing protein [Flavobacterium sp. WG47]
MTKETTFFSYSRSDSEFVLKLAKDLRSKGIELWLDQLDIKAGNRWDASIEAAITSASRIVVFLSPVSVASNNVMDEVSFAMETGKTIIPVLLDKCTIPFRLRRLQHIDFTGNYEVGVIQLLEVLGHDPSTVGSQKEKTINKKESKENQEYHWRLAKFTNTEDAYRQYLEGYPDAYFKNQALAAIQKLETSKNKKAANVPENVVVPNHHQDEDEDDYSDIDIDDIVDKASKRFELNGKILKWTIAVILISAIIFAIISIRNKQLKSTKIETATDTAVAVIPATPDQPADTLAKDPEKEQKPAILVEDRINPKWKDIITDEDSQRINNAVNFVTVRLNNLPQKGDYDENDKKSEVLKIIQSKKLAINSEDLVQFKRVRSIQGDENLFIYDYFSCKFKKEEDRIFFKKTTGSQRKSGYLYKKDEFSYVFLGGYSYNNDPLTSYNSENGEAGILYKISPGKLILIFPQTKYGYEILDFIK